MMVNFSLTELDTTHDFLFGKVRTWSFAVYALILIPRITDNVLLVLVIRFKDALRCFSTPTTYFIVNLAASDLLN